MYNTGIPESILALRLLDTISSKKDWTFPGTCATWSDPNGFCQNTSALNSEEGSVSQGTEIQHIARKCSSVECTRQAESYDHLESIRRQSLWRDLQYSGKRFPWSCQYLWMPARFQLRFERSSTLRDFGPLQSQVILDTKTRPFMEPSRVCKSSVWQERK